MNAATSVQKLTALSNISKHFLRERERERETERKKIKNRRQHVQESNTYMTTNNIHTQEK